jgi:hypothetical protein
MQRPAKPWTPVRFRPQPPSISPGGETGRRKGLKIPRSLKLRAGSIPALGTNSFDLYDNTLDNRTFISNNPINSSSKLQLWYETHMAFFLMRARIHSL